MSATSTKRSQSFTTYDQQMATARFARRLRQHLRLINVLLIINGIAWAIVIIFLIHYLSR